jgi:hypothetical protein
LGLTSGPRKPKDLRERLAGYGKEVGKIAGAASQEIKGRIKESWDKGSFVRSNGLQKDYSVKGRSERFWLDRDHYLVVDLNNPMSMEEAKASVDNYRQYGTSSNIPGPNMVITADESALATKQLSAVSPETQRMGKQLSDTLIKGPSLMPLSSRGRITHGVTGPEEPEEIPEDEIDVDEDQVTEEEEPVKQPRGRSPIYAPMDMSRVMPSHVLRDADVVGSQDRQPGYRVPSIDELMPSVFPPRRQQPVERGASRRQAVRQQPQQQEGSFRPGTYSVPSLDELLPSVFPQRRQQPVEREVASRRQEGMVRSTQFQPSGGYTVPRLDDIMPSIYPRNQTAIPQDVDKPSRAPAKKSPTKKTAPAKKKKGRK